jgi:hypothetical protein
VPKNLEQRQIACYSPVPMVFFFLKSQILSAIKERLQVAATSFSCHLFPPVGA